MCELFPTRQEQINCVSLSCDSQVRSGPIQWMAGWMKKQTSLDQHQQTSPVKIRKLDLLLGSTASLEGCVKAPTSKEEADDVDGPGQDGPQSVRPSGLVQGKTDGQTNSLTMT